MLDQIRSRTDSYLSHVRTGLREAGYVATATTLPGAPAQAIADWVADDPDALVVMSTHGRGGIARWALGSVADKVLHLIPNPMLLVRSAGSEPSNDWEPRAILVPLDGSALSELSLEHAAAMANALKTRIVSLRVSPDAALYRDYLGPAQTDTATADDADWAPVEELIQADAEAASSSLDRAAKRLAGEFGFAGTVVQRTVESRNVAEAITDAAASERAIVVMTTHGHSGINRLGAGERNGPSGPPFGCAGAGSAAIRNPVAHSHGAAGRHGPGAGFRRGGGATGLTRHPPPYGLGSASARRSALGAISPGRVAVEAVVHRQVAITAQRRDQGAGLSPVQVIEPGRSRGPAPPDHGPGGIGVGEQPLQVSELR